MAGLKSQPPRYSFSTQGYDQFQVIFVASGELHLVVRDQDSVAPPGHLVVLPIGAAFRLYTPAADGYGGVFCVLREPLPENFSGPAAWSGPADRAAQQLAGQMQQEIAAPGAGSQELLDHLGSALAWRAVRQMAAAAAALDGTRAQSARYWADSVRQAIQANLFSPRGVRAILADCGLSYRQLARHFATVAGEAPKDYQLRLKISEAQRLLTETNLSITNIAFELGFPSSQHFATQFTRLTGRKPSTVRQRRRN